MNKEIYISEKAQEIIDSDMELFFVVQEALSEMRCFLGKDVEIGIKEYIDPETCYKCCPIPIVITAFTQAKNFEENEKLWDEFFDIWYCDNIHRANFRFSINFIYDDEEI